MIYDKFMYVSIFSQGPIGDIIKVISEGFRAPFCIEALKCLGMILSVSQVSRQYLNTNMLDIMFRGGLTIDLAECLKIALQHVVPVREYIRTQLTNYITALLKQRSEDALGNTDEGKLSTGVGVGGGGVNVIKQISRMSIYAGVASKTLALVGSSRSSSSNSSIASSSMSSGFSKLWNSVAFFFLFLVFDYHKYETHNINLRDLSLALPQTYPANQFQ
jgi:hypothetical protein